MENLSLIAAVGENGELGYNNSLIWRIREDLQFYKEMTMGKKIIMGRKTLVRLTLAVLLAPRFGLVGVWMAMSFELTMRGVLFLVRLVRGRWLDKGALA